MNSFEFNKIFAALLCAGIVVMLGGFISEQLISPRPLHKDAVEISGKNTSSSNTPAKIKTPDPILHLIATADVAKGKKLSKACAACHSFEKGGPHKVGPNLWNIAGAPKAGKAGFSYSSGLSGVGGAWNYTDFNKFLWKPKKFASGIKMNYIGMKKPQDRAAIIAWLRTLSDSEFPLPSDDDMAKEAAQSAPKEAPETIQEIIQEAAPEAPIAH